MLTVMGLLSWLGLVITTAHEQAQTPGEKNLGVAVLAMMWGLPMLAFGVSGVSVLLAHSLVFLYRRFRSR